MKANMQKKSSSIMTFSNSADPDSCMRLTGQFPMIFDPVAVGILRQDLVDKIGSTRAQSVLTRFGFAHGWRIAAMMKSKPQSQVGEAWAKISQHMPEIIGLFRVARNGKNPQFPELLRLEYSFEAEQQLSRFGRSEIPVCGTIAGMLSGFLSHNDGRGIYVVEDSCIGRGDSYCSFFAKSSEASAGPDEHTHSGPEDSDSNHCRNISLQGIIKSLRSTDDARLRPKQAVENIARIGELDEIVSNSPAMAKVINLARRVAKVNSTVLITGESGTGKERIARLVHAESARAREPFIAINCGAITETLLESELFGHARGSFTGASSNRAGLFEAARGGTLLLDEVGEMSQLMQVKLLRVLQEREVRRVGENRNRPTDVRVIAATNRELSLGVSSGCFRRDLYYRLKVIEIHVPPLRERREDILPLARMLFNVATARANRKFDGFAPTVSERMLQYHWPGNVRELENAMECAVALAETNWVGLEDLPAEIVTSLNDPPTVSGTDQSLATVEKKHILAVLEKNAGNQTTSAKQLKIGSATLYRKLKSFGMISDRSRKTGRKVAGMTAGE